MSNIRTFDEWLETAKFKEYDNICVFANFKEGQIYITEIEKFNTEIPLDNFNDNDVSIGYEAGQKSLLPLLEEIKINIPIFGTNGKYENIYKKLENTIKGLK